MKHNIKQSTVDDLKNLYVNAAMSHAVNVADGNYKEANKQYDLLASVFREIRLRGKEAEDMLLGLLRHNEDAVKGWAASHALRFAPNDAEAVLVKLSESGKMPWSFDAEMTLKEWRKGNLK